jgi:hypothetical protein
MPIRTRQLVIRNRAQCRLCGDVIESAHRHDFVSCSCGEISVDGGTAYLRRAARDFSNLIDLSETEEEIYESQW